MKRLTTFLALFLFTLTAHAQYRAVVTDSNDVLAGPPSLEFQTGEGIKTGTSAGNTVLLQGYDTNAGSYVTFATLQAGNPPSLSITEPTLTLRDPASDPSSNAKEIWIDNGASEIKYWDDLGSPAKRTLVALALTQTLSNKTIDTASNTITINEADINDGSIYGRLASAESVTGTWTFTSPVLNDPTLRLEDIADPTSDATRIWMKDGGSEIAYWDDLGTPAKRTLATLGLAQTLSNKTIDTASNTITINEGDINDGSIYGRLGSAESITGTWDFTGGGILLPSSVVDAIGEIAAALRTGSDGKVVTGTATADRAVIFDTNGDAVASTTTKDQLAIAPRAIAGRLPRNGVHFDGRDGVRINAGDSDEFTPPDDAVSFRASFRLDTVDSTRVIAARRESSAREWLIQVDSSGTADVTLFDASDNDANFTTFSSNAGVIEANQTYELVFVWDGTSGQIYLNGEAITTTASDTGTGFSAFSNTSIDLVLGARGASNFQLWKGALHHFSLLNYAATASDVAEAYETGRWPYRLSSGTQVNQLSSPSAFETGDWSKINTSITDTNTTATTDPDGGNAADAVTEDTSTLTHRVDQRWDNDNLAGERIRVEVSAKPNGRNWIALGHNADETAYFDINNGSAGTTGSNVVSTDITDEGNGWYRCVVIYDDPTSTTTATLRIRLANGDNSDDYTGDGSSGVYLYNAVAKPVGVTAGYDMEEGIGFQILDHSGNGNHGVWNQTTGISWLRTLDRGSVIATGISGADTTLLEPGHTLPSHARITAIVAHNVGSGDISNFEIGTSAGQGSGAITATVATFSAGSIEDLTINDAIPGGDAIEELFANASSWGSGEVELSIQYETWNPNWRN